MIAVMFELELEDENKSDYFTIANNLKILLKEIDGFISVERFQSMNNPNKYLSLSLWRDEEAVRTWRNHFEHQQAQKKGREDIFKIYRLRVADIIRDYSMNERSQAPDSGGSSVLIDCKDRDNP